MGAGLDTEDELEPRLRVMAALWEYVRPVCAWEHQLQSPYAPQNCKVSAFRAVEIE
jgi:hypothetical protein